MLWLAGLLVGTAGLSYLAYKSGYDEKIFRAMCSAVSSMFMEITILLMRGGTLLLCLSCRV
jgi:hypothetical protein